MSVRWMDYIIRERRDLRGAELTCAIIIANYASADDVCYPGIRRIADDLRSSVRQTQAIIKRLEEKSVFRIVHGNGRGHKTTFEFIKDEVINTFSAETKGEESNTLSENKGRSFAPEKDEALREERVKVCVPPYKEEPFKEPLIEPITAAEPAAIAESPVDGSPLSTNRGKQTPRAKDERSKHPAIAAYREVTEIYPIRAIWDRIIAALGDKPDVERMKECFTAWCLNGFNPVNTAWLFRWYFDGIPDDLSGRPNHGRNRRGPDMSVGKSADPEPAVIAPKPKARPARASAAEARLWRSICAELRKDLNEQVFATWFGRILCDGFDKGIVKLRAADITVDWVNRYYNEQLQAAIATNGVRGVHWKVETAEMVIEI